MGVVTFVEENHNLLKGLHEVDVVVAVLLDLLQQGQLRLALGAEHSQEGSVLLQREWTAKPSLVGEDQGLGPWSPNHHEQACLKNTHVKDGQPFSEQAASMKSKFSKSPAS